eukprot:4376469-Lingulodinium_polyedra.AAC.1
MKKVRLHTAHGMRSIATSVGTRAAPSKSTASCSGVGSSQRTPGSSADRLAESWPTGGMGSFSDSESAGEV